MRKKSSGECGGVVLLLLLIICAIAAACGLYYATDKAKTAVDVTDKKVEMVDLNDKSRDAHHLIDELLLEKKDNWQLQEDGREAKTETLSSGTEIKWNERKLRIGLPVSTDREGASNWLKEKLKGSELIIVGEHPETRGGHEYYRLDLGLGIKSGKDTQKYVTDSLIFFHNGNLEEPDKDVEKPKPVEAPKPSPQATPRYSGGKLAVVIDDCGYNLAPLKTLLTTKLPFNYAIIPYKPYSGEALSLIRASGRTAMLHLPMEPMDASQMSEGSRTIRVGMKDTEIRSMTLAAVRSLPGIAGVNNHQGSRATSDKATMKSVLRVMKEQGLFFVDSRTSAKSVAKSMALEMGVPTGSNNLFLDNSSDSEEIYAQIKEALSRANKYGSVIVICHARPNTARAWADHLTEIVNSGVEIVPVSELLE